MTQIDGHQSQDTPDLYRVPAALPAEVYTGSVGQHSTNAAGCYACFLVGYYMSVNAYIYIYIHHRKGVPIAQIPFTLSFHPCESTIALGKSFSWHPQSAQSEWKFLLAGQLWWVYIGVHNRTLFISSSLFLQKCITGLIWIVLKIGGKWPHSCCFVGCFFQDLFKTVHIILKWLQSFCFIREIRFLHCQ